jgi:hypothetical protein
MTDPTATNQDVDSRRRLRELLAVPERERTDAQWDEIIAIEIRLAPGNRMEPTRRMDVSSSKAPMYSPSRRKAPPSPSTGKKRHRSGH